MDKTGSLGIRKLIFRRRVLVIRFDFDDYVLMLMLLIVDIIVVV